MSEEFKLISREELTGSELEVIAHSELAARAAYDSFYSYMRALPQDVLNKLASQGFTALIYNAIGMFTLELVAALNENNNISVDDAMRNLEGLNSSVKQMLEKNWTKITDVRGMKANEANTSH